MGNLQEPPGAAVLLVRISDDREGVAAGVARQEADGRALADRLGWTIDQVVVENDTSAYKRRKVRLPNGRHEYRTVRPGFRRVLELIESGAADGFIGYDLDRIARDPRDLEDLIDAVEQRIPRIPVESATGSLRLANDADVTMARVMVAVANKSSRDTSRRVMRKNDEAAAAGRPSGGVRRYGFEQDGVTWRDEEVDVIREAVRRILEGESANAICRDFDERLLLPVKAQRWSSKALLDILRSPRIAGLRVHRGEVVGKAAWAPIISEDVRAALLARLDTNSRGAGKPVLKYWLNGLLFCSLCGEPLFGAIVHKTRYRYWCATSSTRRNGCGRIAIAGPGSEAEVERQVLEYLARPDVTRALTAGSSSTAVEATRRAIADDEAQLRELAQAHGHKQISMAEWLEARRPIDARIKSARAALKAVTPPRVRRVIEADDTVGAWEELSPTDRRELVRVVLQSGGYKGWEVRPADPTGARRFDAGRLALCQEDQ